MSNFIAGLIAVILGGIISWLSNRWVQNNSIKKDIEIKVADKISEKIIELLETSHKLHNMYNTWKVALSGYLDVIKDIESDSSMKKPLYFS